LAPQVRYLQVSTLKRTEDIRAGQLI
jgi:hypothetical protein